MTGLMILVIFWPVIDVYAQDGDKVGKRFVNNVLQLTVKFSNGVETNGFGFVVGEREGHLYAVTANHVLHHSDAPDVKTAEVKVRFFQDQAGKPVTGEALNVSSTEIDTALLRVPKPAWYQWERGVLSSGYKRGDRAWFVGQAGKWFIPTDKDAGSLYDSEPDLLGYVTLSISSVQRGTSGAPLFTENGIVGMVVLDEGDKALAVHIDQIRKLINRMCPVCPWNMEIYKNSPIIQFKEWSFGIIIIVVFVFLNLIILILIRNRFKKEDGARQKLSGTKTPPEKRGFKFRLAMISIVAGFVVVLLFIVTRSDITPFKPVSVTKPTASVTTTVKSESVPVTTVEPQTPEPAITNTIGMKLVYIQPGTFMMGSPPDEPKRYDNETLHEVKLTKGFYMQTTEVTQGQWRAVMGSNPSHFKDCGDNCPVERVSWEDVQEFIKKLNQMEKTDRYRLPTEAEWEYACRAGTTTPFFFGKCLSTDQANYYGNSPQTDCPKGEYREKTVPVASFAPNKWGLYDMHGNVWEWCQDWYGGYPPGSVTDPGGPSTGSYRVYRGGSLGLGAGACRAASRYWLSPVFRSYNLGLRLALSPD